MKKLIVVGLLALLASLGALYGRDLLGLYHLQDYLDTSTRAYEAEGPWPHLTDVCASCHGNRGSSLHQRYPSLAGQPQAYLVTQLQNFASGQRHSPNMQPLAMTLSEADIQRLATYYAAQPAQANPGAPRAAATLESGRQLAASRACGTCHGAQLQGQGGFPRLAGQGYDYLLAQLEAFAGGQRSEPSAAMQAMAASLSTEQRQALAQYLASLAPATP